MLIRGFFLIVLVLLKNYILSQDLSNETVKGKEIFQKKCATCHSTGKGKIIGPDIKGIADRRELIWLKSFIKASKDMIDKKDELAVKLFEEFKVVMPNSELKDDEIDYIIEYLKLEGKVKVEQEKIEVKEVLKGDIKKGKALFEGLVPLKNGGPSCISCHTIYKINIPGGSLGPDLTKAGKSYGKDGIVSILKEIPFPTMIPLYLKKPLTDEEISHISEFMTSLEGENKPRDFKDSFFFIFSGIILYFIVIQFIWSKRLKDVRKKIIIDNIKKEEL